jgi:arylsulfatase A-like enzyme/Tfp pilus assembly protein PilF
MLSIGNFGLFSKTPAIKNRDFNVLVITLDTTRADRIGSYGCKHAQTPNIDEIAGKGVLFENATTPVPLTLPSHCTIFTGTLPLYHNVRNNGRYRLPEQIDTLAEILKKQGFHTAAFVSSFTVDSRFGLDQGFDTYNDDLRVTKGTVKTYHSERHAEAVYKDFAQWFEGDKKFFSWVHFFDPHLPYSPPEPFKSRFRKNPYNGEIAYMDVYVGKVIELLKQKKTLHNTLIVIVGDHGEAFGEHGETGHMMFCYGENINVPLIFYCPDRLPKNRRITTRAGLADIMPTILDFLEIPKSALPDHSDGISLLPTMKGKTIKERTFYIESVFPWEALGCAPVKGIIKDNYKFLDLPKPELYDLEKDGREKDNLYFKKNIRAKKLKQTLTSLMGGYNPLQFQSGRTLSPAEERKLKTLGYVSASRKQPVTGKLPDPKDKIAGMTAFIMGNRLRGEGKRDDAAAHFKRAIQINPSFSWPYSSLALVYVEKGKMEDALNILKKGIENNPSEYQLKIEYAMLLQKQSRYDEAVEILETLNKKEASLVDAAAEINALLGDLYSQKGEKEKAIACYRNALKTEPGNRVLKQKLVFLLHGTNKLREALEIYLNLEKETPGDAGLLFNMAILYEQLKQYDLSKTYYEKLINNKPPVRVYYNYAVLLAKTGDTKEAVKQMQRFIDLYPDDDALKKSAREKTAKWKERIPL